MNGLSLRVSSVKTSDNVRKNAEMRTALAKLPTEYENSDVSFCVEFHAAKTVPEQVSCIKNLVPNVTTDPKVLQFLCDLFLRCPLKHPVRNQIVKILITISKTDENLCNSFLLPYLENSLRNLLSDMETNDKNSQYWNTGIASIIGCFENFDAALKALGQCTEHLLPLVSKSLDKYLNELKSITSPSIRNEYYLYIHNSIRLLLSSVQQFGVSLKETHLSYFEELKMRCYPIILDADIPMDPRTNAGILIAHMARLSNQYPKLVENASKINNPQEIAICVGVINTLDHNDFNEYSSQLLTICKNIHSFTNRHATVPNILLCGTRALYQISKMILNFASLSLLTTNALKVVELILKDLISFCLVFMEHQMDSVRYLSRDIMRNIVAISKKQNINQLLMEIYKTCKSDNLSLSLKCVIIQQATIILGAEEILRNCGDLFYSLFYRNLGKDFIVNNLYETLMFASYKEKSFQEWFEQWISYLLKFDTYNQNGAEIERLIVKAAKCDVKVVQAIVCNEHPHARIKIPISMKLSILGAVRKSGMTIDNFPQLMEKFSTDLKFCILSNNDDIRIMALRLLVETNKSTEPLNDFEYEQVIMYLRYNSNCQSPNTREKSLALLGKALTRCQIGLTKHIKKEKCMEKIPMELEFLKDFVKVLIENLFEGANFGRRSVSLHLLEQCLNIAVDCQLNLMTLFNSPQALLNALLLALFDSFESNKALALNMLKILEKNHSGPGTLIDDYQLNINLNEIHCFLTSVKVEDSVTGSYQMEFLCHHGNPKIFGNSFNELPLNSPCIYAGLQWILIELKKGLQLAEFSILEAAKRNPLYGLLYAMNRLLKTLNFSQLKEEPLWRNLVTEIIALCKSLTNVVIPIVNSSSPEGHLPNDFGELPKELNEIKNSYGQIENILFSKLKIVDMAIVEATPQMVLLCAWRTVKEVSLILGDLVLFSNIKTNDLSNENFLITKEQIFEIGEHFKLLLSETKHRGAFEQAYVGFSKLCCRLWTTKSEDDLNALPMIWLKDLMTLISQEDVSDGKLCATRRSAGVPFMVQAIITTELKVGTTKALMFCMQHLLDICKSQNSSAESRTHSLNILRALFRCTDLSEAVGEYVAEGVMVSIGGYDSKNWSEKNSSTLLFAALITRIFGVQRTKDTENLNIRNRMTGRVFFLRYPKLYDFFLKELDLAGQLIATNQRANKLYPLLLLLSRLYPSALEGTESNLPLSAFIPHITKCGSCPEMQTRYLAAKAIVSLVSELEVPELIRLRCAEMLFLFHESSNFQLNVLHGLLLQVFYLLKHNHGILNKDLIVDVSFTIKAVNERTQLTNAVIYKVILDIYIELMKRCISSESLELLYLFKNASYDLNYFYLSEMLNDNPKLASYYTVLNKSMIIFDFYNKILYMHIQNYVYPSYFTEEILPCKPLEKLETNLNVLLYILAKAQYNFCPINSIQKQLCDIIEEFEIHTEEKQCVDYLHTSKLMELSEILDENHILTSSLQILINDRKYPTLIKKSFAILSFLKDSRNSYDALFTLQFSQFCGYDVQSAALMVVEKLINDKPVMDINAKKILNYLCENFSSSKPYYWRMRCAYCLDAFLNYYPKFLIIDYEFSYDFIHLILRLLMDDDNEIRDFVASLVRIMANKQKMSLFLSSTNNLDISNYSNEFVSSVAQRIFIQYTAEVLLNLNENDTMIGIILHIFMNFKMYDIESNDYAEPWTIRRDSVEIFQMVFNKQPKILKLIQDKIKEFNS